MHKNNNNNRPWMDDSEWVTCPYERSHRVSRSRIQNHLVKCEKKHSNLAICPFNYSHRMDKKDITNHVRQCESRQALNPPDIPIKVIASLTTPKPTMHKECRVEDDEDFWDD